MPAADREHWNKRYGSRGYTAGESSSFVRRHAHLLSGRVLDVAAGAGRNSIFLARQGLEVEAIDISDEGLARAREAARAEGFEVETVCADLTSFVVPPARYGGIVNIRYLERALFPSMRAGLAPGGVLLFETFLEDQGRSGHPRNPAYLLRRGELREVFSDLEVILCEEGLFDDGAEQAYLGRLVARRPVP